MPRTRPTLAGAFLAAAVALGVAAPSAMAAPASITVTDSAGRPDPAAQVARTFTVSGTSDAPAAVFVKSRNVGGASCAPTPDSDTGTKSDLPYGTAVNGGFSLPTALSWPSPGPVLFCVWVTKDAKTVSTPVAQEITFRGPTATITPTINPLSPTAGDDAALTFAGASEIPAKLYAKVRSAGGASCAPTFSADPGETILTEQDVDGTYSKSATVNRDEARDYLVCSWIARSATDAAPLTVQQLTYTVAAPPAPPQGRCKVSSKSVKRRRSLSIRCTTSTAPVKVRFRRNGKVRKTVTVKVRKGKAKASTKGLRPGSYKVSILDRSGKVGSRTVRIRR